MFSKLKDKLKGALSIFSKKTEEVAQEEVDKVIEESKKREEVVEEKEIKKEEPIEETKDDKHYVFLFHGWEGRADQGWFPETLKVLKENNYEAFAYDLPNTDTPTYEEWFEFADKKLAVLKDKKVSLIGHSMGGLLVLKLAEKYKLEKLILVAPIGTKPSDDYFKQYPDLDESSLKIYKQFMERDLSNKLVKKNTKEIVFILGERDKWITKEIREQYYAKFPKATFKLLKDREHFTQGGGVDKLPILESQFVKGVKVDDVEIKEEDITEEPVEEDSAEETPIEESTKEVIEEPIPAEPKTTEQLVEETKKKFDREVAEAELKEVKEKEERTDTLEEAKEKFPEPEEQETPKTEELIEETKKKYDEEVAIEELKDVKDQEELPATEELVEESKEYQDPDHKFAENIVEETETAEEEYFAEEKEEPKEKKSFFGKLKKSLFGEGKEEIVEEQETKEPETEVTEEETKEQPKSFFGKVKKSLTTKTINEAKYNELFWELELVLLENNVSIEVIEKIKEDLKEELVDRPLPRDVPAKIQETLRNTLDTILTHDKVDLLKLAKEKEGPLVIALFGINGTGKTTSVAKLTKFFQNNNKSVVLAACDTFRAAAIQQLGEHAEKLGVKMISHDYGSDAAAVAFDAIKYAEKNNINIVLIDTAGRLHSNTNLMSELEKIIRVTTPDLKIFVGESITGNDCIEQARKFNDLVEMDGAILTKADVDEKGGAPLSISYTIKKPILFLGVGQEYQDLEEFDKEKILERLGF